MGLDGVAKRAGRLGGHLGRGCSGGVFGRGVSGRRDLAAMRSVWGGSGLVVALVWWPEEIEDKEEALFTLVAFSLLWLFLVAFELGY